MAHYWLLHRIRYAPYTFDNLIGDIDQTLGHWKRRTGLRTETRCRSGRCLLPEFWPDLQIRILLVGQRHHPYLCGQEWLRCLPEQAGRRPLSIARGQQSRPPGPSGCGFQYQEFFQYFRECAPEVLQFRVEFRKMSFERRACDVRHQGYKFDIYIAGGILLSGWIWSEGRGGLREPVVETSPRTSYSKLM